MEEARRSIAPPETTSPATRENTSIPKVTARLRRRCANAGSLVFPRRPLQLLLRRNWLTTNRSSENPSSMSFVS